MSLSSPLSTHTWTVPQHFALQKNAVVNTNIYGPVSSSVSAALCPSVQHLSPTFLSSIVCHHLLLFISYSRSSIIHPLPIIYLSTHPLSVYCIIYLCHLSSIVCPLCISCLSIYPASHPSTHHSSSNCLSFIYHLSVFCHPLSIHPSIQPS